MKRLAPLIIAFLLFAAAAQAQEACNTDEVKQARTIFTRLLQSETNATNLINQLCAYSTHSPLELSVGLKIAQRLLVQDFPANEIISTFEPCGDMTVILNGGDEEFATLVFIMAELKRGKNSYQLVESLEQMDVPAYKFLSESTGWSVKKIQKDMAKENWDGKIVCRLLLESFNRHYAGTAAELVKKQRKEN
ncbi:MAG TPA: hypothetical protein VGC91_07855 [Pyrinomonadaceae bacterium]|jgi:hypothetical protein